MKNSVVRPTGNFGENWPQYFNFTQGKDGLLSSAGWSSGNEGVVQQTFLGASIRSFSINAGFGDTSSTLSIELVEDEFNKSDETGLGLGDDVYHNGKYDKFSPPVVGSPVFFKFGKNFATVEQAWRPLIDMFYKSTTTSSTGVVTVTETTLPNFPSTLTETQIIDLNKSNIEKTSAGDPFYPFGAPSYHIIDDPSLSTSGVYAGDRENLSGTASDEFANRGKNHFVFGGILQSFNQSRSVNGNPLINIQVVDPREILSNVSVILANYAGSIYESKNFLNVFGFLEYDPSDELKSEFESSSEKLYSLSVIEIDDPTKWSGVLPDGTIKNNNILEKKINKNNLDIDYFGTDIYYFKKALTVGATSATASSIEFPKFFPITGEGYARRSDQGIPWYRVRQALQALTNYWGEMPDEYKNKSFGGPIGFRNFNYAIDFKGIPLEKIPKMYFLDFDTIDILSLFQEVCDTINHDLYITLLPVINHPYFKDIHEQNKKHTSSGEYEKIIQAVIKIDAIDRSNLSSKNEIEKFINDLTAANNIKVESQNLGFELSNVVTDKIVVGAQEVEMHFFNDNRDRNNLHLRRKNAGISSAEFEELEQKQWNLETSLKQQILPFYGFIGKDVPTIPRGFGAYKQIMLDATGLDADGVGNYYIATEMELRCALTSYETWADFLLQYNVTYLEDVGSLFLRSLAGTVKADDSTLATGLKDLMHLDPLKNREFAVTVPRCVFVSEKNNVDFNGLPESPCSPPFGYPLYYKRAERIGIPQAGIIKISNATLECMTKYEKLEEEIKRNKGVILSKEDKSSILLENMKDVLGKLYPNFEKDYQKNQTTILQAEKISKEINDAIKLDPNKTKLRDLLFNNRDFIVMVNYLQRRQAKNARKVYNFIRDIAEKHLGKTFLVKIPKSCNVNYDANFKFFDEKPATRLVIDDGNESLPPVDQPKQEEVFNLEIGPFGFKPIPVSSVMNHYSFFTDKTKSNLDDLLKDYRKKVTAKDLFTHYLEFDTPQKAGIATGVTGPSPLASGATGATGASGASGFVGYKYGALKAYFNPISDNWEFNYKPESQGGYFEYQTFDKNITLSSLYNMLSSILDWLEKYAGTSTSPISSIFKLFLNPNFAIMGIANGLIPVDLSPFENNGRISPYVRFNNSKYLDFSSIGKENLTQQIQTGLYWMPDVMEELENISIDTLDDKGFDISKTYGGNFRDKDRRQSVTFVKCELDDKFYLLPKIEKVETNVYGREVKNTLISRPVSFIEVIDSSGNKQLVESVSEAVPIWDLAMSGGWDGATTEIIEFKRIEKEFAEQIFLKDVDLLDTRKENLSSDHVYAIITIPGKITPTVDQRYLDGPYQAIKATDIKHSLTQDVVKPEASFKFDKPGFAIPSGEILDDILKIIGSNFLEKPESLMFIPKKINDALTRYRQFIGAVNFANKEYILNFVQPSPVYPNLVALPLMSTERCYGPWRSSSLINNYSPSGERYANIGGKVEFLKKEQLAPWNYGGFQLMNEAGILEADTSNALLLYNERGDFSFPGIPQGIHLGMPLSGSGGPLITSISVNISNDSVNTSVKLDLYTPKFGKLNNQKEKLIANIAREKQKILDQKNYFARRGFAKARADNDILSKVKEKGQQFIRQADETIANINNSPPDKIVLSLEKISEPVKVLSKNPIIVNDKITSGISTVYRSVVNLTNSQQLQKNAEIILGDGDTNHLNRKYTQTAGSSFEELFTGYSTLPIGTLDKLKGEYPSFPTLPYFNYIEEAINRS